MDNIQHYLDKLGISSEEGNWNKERSIYTIPLKDSNEYARVYTKLDNADWLQLAEGDLSLQEESSSLLYISDNIFFTLKSNFLEDKYSLEVREEI